MPDPTLSPFAVELALPLSQRDLDTLQATLAAASRRLRDRGLPVRFVQIIQQPDQRGAVCLFEAESQAAVRKVVQSAQVPFSRIAETTGLGEAAGLAASR
jgi:uncharacterized protein DUF4242